MPKVRVTSEFRDARSFSLIHPVGEILEVSEERAAKLVALSFAERVEDEPAKEEKKPRAPRQPRRKVTTENTVENDG